MSIYLRGETFHASIVIPGRGRIRCSLGTTDKLAAERSHDELKAKLWSQPRNEPGQRAFGEALAAWLKAKQRSRSDINAARTVRERVGSLTAIAAVTPALFAQKFADKGPSTSNRFLAIVRAALNIAHELEWVDRVPAFKKRTEPAPQDRYLTGEEWLAIRAELPEHLQVMADFAVATGLRWSNVADLQWRQIRGTTLSIQAGNMKSNKAIGLPLSAGAMAVLDHQAGKHPTVVFPYNGRAIASPKTAFNKARVRAGLPHVRWHDLRHTWASWHAMAGTPEQVLQKLGGWNTDMHRRYAHLAPQYLAGFADNAKPVDFAGGKAKVA